MRGALRLVHLVHGVVGIVFLRGGAALSLGGLFLRARGLWAKDRRDLSVCSLAAALWLEGSVQSVGLEQTLEALGTRSS